MRLTEEHKTTLVGYLLAIILALQIFSAYNRQLIDSQFQSDLFSQLLGMRCENIYYLQSIATTAVSSSATILRAQSKQLEILSSDDKDSEKAIENLNKRIEGMDNVIKKMTENSQKIALTLESCINNRKEFLKDTEKPLRRLKTINKIVDMATMLLVMITIYFYTQILNSISQRLKK